MNDLPDGSDWSLLTATQDALREHMAEIHRLREAARMALEAIEERYIGALRDQAIDALREALGE